MSTMIEIMKKYLGIMESIITKYFKEFESKITKMEKIIAKYKNKYMSSIKSTLEMYKHMKDMLEKYSKDLDKKEYNKLKEEIKKEIENIENKIKEFEKELKDNEKDYKDEGKEIMNNFIKGGKELFDKFESLKWQMMEKIVNAIKSTVQNTMGTGGKIIEDEGKKLLEHGKQLASYPETIEKIGKETIGKIEKETKNEQEKKKNG